MALKNRKKTFRYWQKKKLSSTQHSLFVFINNPACTSHCRDCYDHHTLLCMNLHTDRSQPQQPSAMNCKVTMYLKAQQWQNCKEHDTKYLNTQHFLPSLKSQLFLAYASNSNSKFLSVVFEMSKQLQVNLHFCLVAPWRLNEKQCFYVQGIILSFLPPLPHLKPLTTFCDSAANTPLVDMLFTAATPHTVQASTDVVHPTTATPSVHKCIQQCPYTKDD